jgi:hypothetical protein
MRRRGQKRQLRPRGALCNTARTSDWLWESLTVAARRVPVSWTVLRVSYTARTSG